MFVADKELNIIYFNDAAATLTGWPKEEALGKKCRDIFRATICDSNCAIGHCMKENTTIQGAEVSVKSRTGNEIVVSANAAPVKDASGNIVGGMEIMRDITQQKELERKIFLDAARASSRIYDPIFTVDCDHVINFFNDAAEQLTGYKREEAIGKKCYDIFKSNICDNGCAVKKCVDSGERIMGAEIKIKGKNLKEISVMARADILRDGEGKIVGGMEIMRDIRQEKSMLDKIKGISDKLTESSEGITTHSQQITAATNQIAESIGQVATGASSQSDAASKAAGAIDVVSTAINSVVQTQPVRLQVLFKRYSPRSAVSRRAMR
jgi:PAS domain S-box-containing protein